MKRKGEEGAGLERGAKAARALETRRAEAAGDARADGTGVAADKRGLPPPMTFTLRGHETNLVALHLVACDVYAEGGGGRYVVTVYYRRGTSIHQYTVDPDCMAYDPRSDQVHNQHPLHHSKLHRADDPYELHTHVLVTEAKLWRFVEKLLARQIRRVGPEVAPALTARLRSAFTGGGGAGKDVRFADGCTAQFSACADEQVFDRMADMVQKLSAARGDAARETAAIQEAIKFIRPDTAVSYVERIVEFVGIERLVGEKVWKGHLVHLLVETGCVDALCTLAQKYAAIDVNAQRPDDLCTPLHVACWKRKNPNLEAQYSGVRESVVDVLVSLGADPEVKNKWGESCSSHPLVKEARIRHRGP